MQKTHKTSMIPFMSSQRSLLVTAALPYANGPIHLGHMLEYIQSDIWVRYQRLSRHTCFFICGDDAHGTPVMLSAQKQNITPEALTQKIHQEHQQDFKDFFISVDNFYTTHSPENRELSELVYQRLKSRGDITEKIIAQAFDPVENIFLPDRFVRGTCPRCDAKDQYGDNCEVCGSTYSPSDLKNAVSALSGVTPITKESEHYFFELDHYQDFLKTWIEDNHLQPHVMNKLKEWFHDRLKPWDITRDAPYFGFEIPGAPHKYFYVWLDAPIGYMASFKNFCAHHNEVRFDDYWLPGTSTELYHFIGKDIIYFHALFWPAMLKGADFRLPTKIFAHGYLTLNGEKMSKSRGTFITARNYLDQLNPEYLRYYFAAKLSAQIEDIDLNLEDFKARVNSDLVGKYVNLASRSAGFITKKFDGKLAATLPEPALYQEFIDRSDSIRQFFESLNYQKAVREIMQLADRANQYVDQMQPWALAKDPEKSAEVQGICTQALNLFKVLTVYLKPILPVTAEKIEQFLNIPPLDLQTFSTPLLNHIIHPFEPLMQRITDDDIQKFC